MATHSEIIMDLKNGICNSFFEEVTKRGCVNDVFIKRMVEYPYNVRLFLLYFCQDHNEFQNSFNHPGYLNDIYHTIQEWTLIETITRIQRGVIELDSPYCYELIYLAEFSNQDILKYWNNLLTVCPNYQEKPQLFEIWLKTLFSFLCSISTYFESKVKINEETIRKFKTSYELKLSCSGNGWFTFITLPMKVQLLKCLLKNEVEHPITTNFLNYMSKYHIKELKDTLDCDKVVLHKWISSFMLPLLPADDRKLMETLSRGPHLHLISVEGFLRLHQELPQDVPPLVVGSQ